MYTVFQGITLPPLNFYLHSAKKRCKVNGGLFFMASWNLSTPAIHLNALWRILPLPPLTGTKFLITGKI